MIVLDTTVLRYAKGADHPYREPCRELVAAVRAGQLPATTTVEVIQEFVWGKAARRGRSAAVELARDYLDLLAPLLPVGDSAAREALRLFERHQSLGSFDAMLAAAAMEAGTEALVSADAAFGEIRGLRHVIPDHAGVARLLG